MDNEERSSVPTHYEVLGVERSADHAEIRRAYHRAARQWHPDRYVDAPDNEATRAETEMRRVNHAWQVLGEEERRKAYDRELDFSRRRGGSADAGATGDGRRGGPTVGSDGVVRIDPRLLDPEYVRNRRYAQYDEISHRSSMVVRIVPLIVLLGLLLGIFVFSAYARSGSGVVATSTVPGPSLGEGIEAGDCVTILDGPALLPRPCDGAAPQVLGARLPDGVCPLGTVREVDLTNGVTACLGPAVG